jgi:hypothetical protein
MIDVATTIEKNVLLILNFSLGNVYMKSRIAGLAHAAKTIVVFTQKKAALELLTISARYTLTADPDAVKAINKNDLLVALFGLLK